MSSSPHNNEATLRRERAVLRYLNALDHGDYECLDILLRQAMNDALLESILWETLLAYADAQTQEITQRAEQTFQRDAEQVRELAASHFSARVTTEPTEAFDIPEPQSPLTVGDVAADLRRHPRSEAFRSVLLPLERSREPLGEDVSKRGVRTLLARLGLAEAGRKFLDLFHDAAFSLQFQRQQSHVVRLAATRRQKSLQSRSVKEAATPYPPEQNPSQSEENAE